MLTKCYIALVTLVGLVVQREPSGPTAPPSYSYLSQPVVVLGLGTPSCNAAEDADDVPHDPGVQRSCLGELASRGPRETPKRTFKRPPVGVKMTRNVYKCQ